MKKFFILVCFNFLFGYVGVISAINGEVFVRKENKLFPLHLGDKIEKQDVIVTKNGILQIIFKDKTVITIGKNSIFSIKKYIFDLHHEKNNIAKFSATKGLFKIITGKIGEINPKKFKIKTANSTIGIRGTIILLKASLNFDKVACLGGVVVVYSNNTRKYVILKPGFMTIVKNNEAPKKPMPITKIESKSNNKIDLTISSPITNNIQENKNANTINNFKVEYIYKSNSLSYGFYLDRDNNPVDVWLDGKEAPSFILDSIFKTDIKATYEGKANAIFNNQKLLGSVSATIDFGAKTIDGRLKLDNNKWIFDFSSSIDKNGFNTALVANSNSQIKGSGNIDGKFYNKGEKIGGHFNISTSNGRAKGVYGAVTSINNLR